MLALHDFRCMNCGVLYESLQEPDVEFIDCICCDGKAKKTFEFWTHRRMMKFPEGVYHGLPNEPYITSRRQLREEVKRASKDRFSECYARYDDGYAGF